MSGLAVRAENLGKQYRIGRRLESYRTLRDMFASTVSGTLRRRHDGSSRPARDETIWALKNISFEIAQGEVVGIVGRNGAGKSTLLKVLTRITEPTEGYAELHGRAGSLLEVGTGFHPELTGRENTYLNGAILGMRKTEIDRRFDEIVDFAEIEKFLDTPVKRYSSGMYVRLAFAVAAHLEPEILLVDEVLAVGDAAFQKKCLGKMGEVAKTGRTVLFVSHNLGAVSEMCSRCLLLDQGVLRLAGPTEEVIAAYLWSGLSDQPVSTFEPSSSEAQFESAGVYGADGVPGTLFDVRRPVVVRCEFTLARRIPGLELGLAVLNFRGERVFYSSNVFAEPPLVIEEAGQHCITAQIPARILPPGRYTINVALHQPNVQLYDLKEHVLHFDVEETGSGRQSYLGQDIGCVLVDVAWQRQDRL